MKQTAKRKKESIISVGDRDFKIIVNSFLEAALFSGFDSETDEMLDTEYDLDDFDEQSKEKVRSIVREFLSSVEGKGLNPYTIVQKTRQEVDDIGIDLFMTMTGQGVGFWDGDWGEYGGTLTNIADQLKEVHWIEGAFPLGANGQIVLENHKNQNTITLPENVTIDMGDREVILEKGDRVRVVEQMGRNYGFALTVGNEFSIEDSAVEDGIAVDWNTVNKDIAIIERNILNLMKEKFSMVRDEGHDGDGDLIGTVIEAFEGQIERDFMDDEILSSTSGTFPFEDRAYLKGTSNRYDIEVHLVFFE